jgi:hypothetical protein
MPALITPAYPRRRSASNPERSTLCLFLDSYSYVPGTGTCIGTLQEARLPWAKQDFSRQNGVRGVREQP